VAELRGHTDYVYSVAVGHGDSGRLLSCGEDHSAVCPPTSMLGSVPSLTRIEDMGR
jgi:hypothetical protein